MIKPIVKYSCGHGWIECPECEWNTPIDWQPKNQIVSLLTAGGSMPIDDFVKEEIAKNDHKRRKAFAKAYQHIREKH